jgi:Protein of unknown function (DUF1622)
MLLHIRVVRRTRVRERVGYRLIDLHRLSLGASLGEDVISDGPACFTAVDRVGLSVDGLGVGVIVTAIAIAGLGFIRGLLQAAPFAASHRQMRQSIRQGVLLGLELLMAGDIIRTVASRLVGTSARSMR